MHIYNITFVCGERELPSLLGHLSLRTVPALLDRGLGARPRLARVISSQAGEAEAESISLQMEFEHAADFALWKKEVLPPAMGAVRGKFGERVFTFATLLKELPLKEGASAN